MCHLRIALLIEITLGSCYKYPFTTAWLSLLTLVVEAYQEEGVFFQNLFYKIYNYLLER